MSTTIPTRSLPITPAALADPTAALVLAVLTDWLPSATDARLITAASATFGSDWRYLLDMVQAANRCKPKPVAL